MYKYLFVFFAGLLTVLGFAPFSLFPLPIFTLAVLFYYWHHSLNKWTCAKLGFVFGFGFFTAGIGWLYVALHDYGDLPVLIAASLVGLFTCFYALFPATVGFTFAIFRKRFSTTHALPPSIILVILLPVLWVIFEWLRGLLFTGLPWLVLGYSQVPTSPLAGYAPLLGVYGVSLFVVFSAGLVVYSWEFRYIKRAITTVFVLSILWFIGGMLKTISWTEVAGEPLKVSLLQGNISQNVKFEPRHLQTTLEIYQNLVMQSDAQLIVMPETALPMLVDELPLVFRETLTQHARQNQGDIILGIFEHEHNHYFNSVVSLGSSNIQHYRKNHLVPFGEFIPLRPLVGWLINDILNIPMSDQARGGEQQELLAVAGQRIAVDICYEDVFGEEIIRYLPAASLLVNVTNDAWYGKSHAAMQHNQISQMRALETGRMMLRATNTGVTSIIDRNGYILKMLTQHETGSLNGIAQGYKGSTPYVRWGNNAILIILIMLLLLAGHRQIRSAISLYI